MQLFRCLTSVLKIFHPVANRGGKDSGKTTLSAAMQILSNEIL